ncbi:hypothetical protein RUM43_010870 [Polyplax serrata]|uniref:Spaetzle domain-containing protein n=1 Tax=Polyplax serrata TaxID=468196 RepID=A0AAN8PTY5_POLSC
MVFIVTVNICKSDNGSNSTVLQEVDEMEVSPRQMNETNRNNSSESSGSFGGDESNENDLDFEYDEDEEAVKDVKDADTAEKQMQEALLKAMKKPSIQKQIGEVIPILRVMSPAQRLTLAALVSSQIMSHNTLTEANLPEIASMFAGKNLENQEERNNVTEYLLLPISMDIAKMFRGLGREVGRNLRDKAFEVRPRKGSHHSKGQFKRRQIRKPYPPPPPPPPLVVKRRIDDTDYYEFVEDDNRNRFLRNRSVVEIYKQPGKEECDYFTKSLCLEVTNYPTEAIVSSLRKHSDIAKTFLIDFDVQTTRRHNSTRKRKVRRRQLDRQDRRHPERRQDDRNDIPNVGGEEDSNYMCPSTVKYARPKRARTTSGDWKYIVNTGDYTQTLRLEMCMKPNSPCSYVTNQINSECAQVFNYHRLLTWDETKGLHMDVFKVPSCCSCRVQGYSNLFPPNNEFTYAENRREPLHNPEIHKPVQERPLFPPIPQEKPIYPPQVKEEVVPPIQERPKFNNVGSNVEVPSLLHLGNVPVPSVKSHVLYHPTAKDFPKNLAEHLVPPGPPLPLENEGLFENNVPEESNVRYSVVTEAVWTTERPTERVELNRPSNPVITRLNTPPPIVHPTPVVISQTHHHVVLPATQYETNTVVDQSGQIRYIIPLVNNPLPLSKEEIKNVKSTEGSNLFNTGNRPSGHKSNIRPSVQYYSREANDNRAVGSRVKPVYVTPPREVTATTTTTTTTSPPPKKSEIITASGHKKINYNYHPIIDFFRTEANKKRQLGQSVYSAPTQASQDWTPVLGQ